jgi:hypothetical protein
LEGPQPIEQILCELLRFHCPKVLESRRELEKGNRASAELRLSELSEDVDVAVVELGGGDASAEGLRVR